jgi:hypothetical protein
MSTMTRESGPDKSESHACTQPPTFFGHTLLSSAVHAMSLMRKENTGQYNVCSTTVITV